MPEKTPTGELQALIENIGTDGKDKDGALQTMAKGLADGIGGLTGLVASLLAIESMEKSAKPPRHAHSEAAAKKDEDPANDDANEHDGDGPDEARKDDDDSGYDDMNKGMPALGAGADGNIDATAFLGQLWNRMEALEKGQATLIKLVKASSAETLHRDALVGTAVANGFSVLAKAAVDTKTLLMNIPAVPVDGKLPTEVALAGQIRTAGASRPRRGSDIGNVVAQQASGLTMGQLAKALNRQLVTEDNIRLWKQSGRLHPEDGANTDLVSRVKAA